jgi:nucleotide-binding universal stress UspA family protein
MPKVKKILVPIDFSEESSRALRYAVSLATETKSEVIVLHVVEKRRQHNSLVSSLAVLEGCSYAANDAPTIPVDLLLQERALDLWNFIQMSVKGNSPVRITRKLRMGSLVKEIAAITEKENIDLMVLELRRRFPFGDFAALKLLKEISRIPCPILLNSPIESDGHEAKRPVVSFQTNRRETTA